LHTKNAFALIMLRLYSHFSMLRSLGLFDLFFFLDKKEPKNQDRNMRQRSLYKCK